MDLPSVKKEGRILRETDCAKSSEGRKVAFERGKRVPVVCRRKKCTHSHLKKEENLEGQIPPMIEGRAPFPMGEKGFKSLRERGGEDYFKSRHERYDSIGCLPWVLRQGGTKGDWPESREMFTK